MKKLDFFALGGQDEKGKNCLILEIENDIYMINAGVKHPIVAKLGIDTIIPNFDYIKLHQNNFKGIFITNAHDEYMAALPWLLLQLKKIKIYTSEFVAAIIANRLEKYQIPKEHYEIIVLPLNSDYMLNGINIKTYELASSMPQTFGLNFQTDEGDVLFLSSFVLNNLTQFCGTTDLEYIKNSISNKGILSLMIDAGFSNYQGYANEKALIRPLIETKIREFPKNNRIIISTYDHSLSTVEEIMKLALECKRPLIIYGSALDFSLKKWLQIHPNMIKNIPQINNHRDIPKINNAIVIVSGIGSRLYQRIDRIAEHNDVYLKLKPTDLFMVIAPPINGHEKFASRAEDKVAETTTHLVDIPRENFYDSHPASQDIFRILKTLKPKYVIPVSGLYCYLSNVNKIAKKIGMMGNQVISLSNAKKIHITQNNIEIEKKEIPNSYEIIIDGLGIGDIAPSVILERENLARDGVILSLLVFDRKTHKLKKDIIIITKGVIDESRKIDFVNTIKEKIQTFIDEIEKWDFRDTQTKISKIIQKTSRKILGKVPITLTNIFEI